MSRIVDFIKARPVATTLAGAALLLAGVGVASAQYQGGWGGPGGWRHGGHGGPGGWGRQARMERFCAMPSARFQPVVRAYVKADLNLTPAQAAEFDKLADVIAPAFEAIKGDVCGNFGPNAAKATPPEKLEKLAAALRKAADAAQSAVAPAKSFYGQLDDAQKAQIDQRMQQRRAMMGMQGQGQGRMGGQWGGGPGGQGGQMMGPGGQGGWGRGGMGGGYGQSPSGPGGPFYQGQQQ